MKHFTDSGYYSDKLPSQFDRAARACDTCGAAFEADKFPTFQESGVYVVQKVRCYSESCGGVRQNGVPVTLHLSEQQSPRGHLPFC